MNRKQIFLYSAALLVALCCTNTFAALPITTGLQLWLDASNTSSIVATDGTLNNGDRISNWNDILVGDNSVSDNATQADEPNQPVWIENIVALNGHSAIEFDSLRTYMNLSSLNIGASPTIFIVCQTPFQSWNQSSALRAILAADNDPIRTDGDGYGMYLPREWTNNSIIALLGEGYAIDQVTGNIPSSSPYHMVSFSEFILRRNANAVDGTELYRQSLIDPCDVLLDVNKFYRTTGFHTGYRIGHDGGSDARIYLGAIAEIVIYNRRLDDTEMGQVSDYLKEKYLTPHDCSHPKALSQTNIADLNQDCNVDLFDFSIMASQWLDCGNSISSDCQSWWPQEIAKERWNNWIENIDTFPIAAWSYFHVYDGTDLEYQTYEQANLTMVQTPIGGNFYSALKAGLKPIIGSWQGLTGLDRLDQYINYPESGDSSVSGYFLVDEPGTLAQFEDIARSTMHIYNNDKRGAIPIVNLWGGTPEGFTDYEDYVNTYIEMVKPAVLLYDCYPIYLTGNDRADFYEMMELYRQKALDNEIGFMAIVSNIETTALREPSESDLNWEVWSYISYGAKGIWYYNYRINGDFLGWGQGLVDHTTGNPNTNTYPVASAINADLKAMGPTLLALKSLAVYHTGSSVPAGTTQYINGNISFLSDFTGDDFILGEFENQVDVADTADYLVITNKRHSYSTTSAAEAADAIFTPNGALPVYQFNTTTQAWDLLTGGAPYTINIGGGQAVLLKLN